MSETKRPRRANFSESEEIALATAVKDRQLVLFGRFEGDKVTKSAKDKAWIEVRDLVNATGGNGRDVAEIKQKYKNFKSSAKKVLSDNRQQMVKTGGGKAKIKELTESQSLMVSTIPPESISGIVGGIDLDDIRKEGVLKSITPDTIAQKTEQLEETKEVTQSEANTTASSCTTIALCSVPASQTQISQALVYVDPNVNTTTVPSAIASTSSAPPPTTTTTPPTSMRFTLKKRSHKKIESSPTEVLLREQVELLKEQVNVMKDIKELMKKRNEIELKKLELKQEQLDRNIFLG